MNTNITSNIITTILNTEHTCKQGNVSLAINNVYEIH